ncbi:Pirin domain protein [Coriobacterium glomerans PW2]|uniref:Pirin domain protein n=2 Tax=Coriobacterium TaxID=33870 RepID=F2NAI0_CORGP|nr:Pirin domain protein [Coriobacterium glomerans PW2]
MERQVMREVTGTPTIDGAGVLLNRYLGFHTVQLFDPILVLDLFDSTDSEEYTAGFPLHPHRGIECISYVMRGRLLHRDSLGLKTEMGDGDLAWMCAGSGIMHEERIPSTERHLGIQIWLNLPQQEKMARPEFRCIHTRDMKTLPFTGGSVRLLAGTYLNARGHRGAHLPLDLYHISLEPGARLAIPVDSERSVAVLALEGDAIICGTSVAERTAVKLSGGHFATVAATQAMPAQLLFISSLPLKEHVAWGGPIVMNTQSELDQAFAELRRGKFLRDTIDYAEV